MMRMMRHCLRPQSVCFSDGLFVCVHNLHHINVMVAALGSIPFFYVRVEKTFGLDFVFIEFAALQSEASLRKSHVAQFCFHRLQTGFGYLVKITTRLRTAEVVYLASLLTVAEELQCHAVVVLYEMGRIAFGPDKDDRHGLVPQPSRSSPGCSHGVELFLVARCNEHPFLANCLKDIVIERLNIYLLHFLSFVLVFLLQKYKKDTG